jgi:hypothetical protein
MVFGGHVHIVNAEVVLASIDSGLRALPATAQASQ